MTDSLAWMLILSVIIGCVNAVVGYLLAVPFDVSIAGNYSDSDISCFWTYLYDCSESWAHLDCAQDISRQKWEFAQTMLVIHLFNHEGLPEAQDESEIAHLHEHLRWEPTFATRVVKYALNNRYVSQQATQLMLTDRGRAIAQQALVQ